LLVLLLFSAIVGCENEDILDVMNTENRNNYIMTPGEIFSENFDRSDGSPENGWTVDVETDTYRTEPQYSMSITHLQIDSGSLYAKGSNFTDYGVYSYASSGMKIYRNGENYSSENLPFKMEFSFYYNWGDAAMWLSIIKLRFLLCSGLASDGSDGTGVFVTVNYNSGVSRVGVVKNNSEVSYMDYSFNTNTWYCFKTEMYTNEMKIKVWKQTDSEPESWTVTSETSFAESGNNLNIFCYLENYGTTVYGSWNEIRIDDLLISGMVKQLQN